MALSFTTGSFSLVSRVDGIRLYGLCVSPEQPVAVLQLSHGMAEHKERYLPFMEFMAAHGVACVIHDHRGHGESAARPENLGCFGPLGREAIVEDLYQVSQLARRRYPDLPLYLLGHSMGTLVARCYLHEHAQAIRGLILTGSPSANPAAGLAVALCSLVGKIKGPRYRSPLLQKLTTGPFDKPFAAEKLPNSWICSDRAVVEKYNRDPLCGFPFAADGYKALVQLLRDAYARKTTASPELPVYFFSGEQDPCHGGEKKFRAAVRCMEKNGYRQVSSRLYPGMRHEVLNEQGKEQVWQDILDVLLGWASKA